MCHNFNILKYFFVYYTFKLLTCSYFYKFYIIIKNNQICTVTREKKKLVGYREAKM